MSIAEQGGKVAVGVVDGLKNQPLALALIVINVLFLAGGLYFLHQLGDLSREQAQSRAALFNTLLTACNIKKE